MILVINSYYTFCNRLLRSILYAVKKVCGPHKTWWKSCGIQVGGQEMAAMQVNGKNNNSGEFGAKLILERCYTCDIGQGLARHAER